MTGAYPPERLSTIEKGEQLARILAWATQTLTDLEAKPEDLEVATDIVWRLEAGRLSRERGGPKKAGER